MTETEQEAPNPKPADRPTDILREEVVSRAPDNGPLGLAGAAEGPTAQADPGLKENAHAEARDRVGKLTAHFRRLCQCADNQDKRAVLVQEMQQEIKALCETFVGADDLGGDWAGR